MYIGDFFVLKMIMCTNYIAMLYSFQKDKAEGLNVLTTCVFVVGVIAGSGFLTLPKAIEDAGKTFNKSFYIFSNLYAFGRLC